MGSFVLDLARLIWKERKCFICLQEGDFSLYDLAFLFFSFFLSNIRGDVRHLSDSLRLFPWRPIFSVSYSAGQEWAGDAAGPLGIVVTVVM